MAKVYVVTKAYDEWDTSCGERYDSDLIIGVFDRESKAIKRIRDLFVKDHEWLDKAWTDDQYVTKYDPDKYEFEEGKEFISCSRYKDDDTNMAVYYWYQSYDVE